jgi:hypothetical protein
MSQGTFWLAHMLDFESAWLSRFVFHFLFFCVSCYSRCELHQDQTFDFGNPGDALKHAPNGGCTLICNDTLNCGHRCSNVCHPMVQDHSETICWAPCERKCDAGIHNCKKACYVKCGSDCAEIVCKELPCGHSANVKCSTDTNDVSCKQEVEKEFPLCQHTGIVPCSSNTCPSVCTSQVPCGHSCVRRCHLDYDADHLKYICQKPCGQRKKNCSADHPCTKACHEDCDLCVEKVRA